jgi:hypothetical protein
VVNASSHRAVTLQSHKGMLFKVNDHCPKIFLEPTRPNEVVDEFDFIYLNYDSRTLHYEKLAKICLSGSK